MKSTPLKLFQEIIVAGEDHGGRPLPIRGERIAIGLHGAIKIVELRILAEAVRIDAGGVGVRFGADDLRLLGPLGPDGERLLLPRRPHRSEEHTSALQSLMRISYAVFCLKKTKQKLEYI